MRANGLAFLDKLMRLHPTPVVMVSTLTTKGASETLLALELGAVDFVAKPNATLSGGLEAFGENLRHKAAFAERTDARYPSSPPLFRLQQGFIHHPLDRHNQRRA